MNPLDELLAEAKETAHEGYQSCTVCGQSLPLTEEYFYFRKDRRYFYRQCKRCRNQMSGSYISNNKKRYAEHARKWRARNPERAKEVSRRSARKTQDKRVEYNKEWRRKNADYFRAYSRANHDPEYQKKYVQDWYYRPKNNVSCRMRANMYKACCTNSVPNWLDHVDYILEELMQHLESQFVEGMSWENMKEWEIDHIRPIDSFGPMTLGDKEFKRCFALDNLQPLWKHDNRTKSNRRK